MARAFRLARRGLYTTDPNPRVGCVIADSEHVIGSGWHRLAGGPHAEIEALQQAGPAARGNTAYITLEPCSHHGRTAPCTQALLAAGISRVVIAGSDPNPQVNGKGLSRLTDAGVTVEHGLMAQEAESLNPGFLMRMRSGRPWVRIKIAISLDGRTALQSGESQWISSEASRRDVQRWRARSSAILTGIGTVLADNPAMNARLDREVLQPVRIIADSRWRTPPDCRMLTTEGDVVIAGSEDVPIPPALAASRARCLPLPVSEEGIELAALLAELSQMEINEVQVEAGSRLAGALLKTQLADELLIYQAPVLLGSGGAGPFEFGPLESMTERTHLKILETLHMGSDLRIRLQPE
ncbi:MAG: bifunctional diaminohydroxyphosphoribosylaminopyrimidine deaminase/5-amino-6-(5-phosphoribosylamino)uracil reductase RibD [Xanthomonadales bacterium]|nr:bifunctional diaminohydroxyphosphoribosylaminopyrimidine deaminase/5-amino-6-(5-phosphoribosylamino)uracil reductase RibD [Xanthomonadales bacterium]MDH3941984.1 bifunctional diaminohydroxyphosphoribosylaminopyrimidine deaminase/5-amino-6-(5-phosphoribosylamino)uracil reductase RibD [Xanthomonadales bacterium]